MYGHIVDFQVHIVKADNKYPSDIVQARADTRAQPPTFGIPINMFVQRNSAAFLEPRPLCT